MCASGAFGDWEAAYGMYRGAIAAKPDHVPALVRLGSLVLKESNEVPAPAAAAARDALLPS